MAYDSLVLKEFKKHCDLEVEDITKKINDISRREYEKWLNSDFRISRIRDLLIWRFSQFMEHIFNFEPPNAESVAYIFQLTLSSARSLIKDYKAQYGRIEYIKRLRKAVSDILETHLTEARKKNATVFKIPFQSSSQIDELFESVRRIATNDPKIEEPQREPNKPYVLEIMDSTADKAIQELRS
jgi:predicted CopG family antitoxin